VEAHLALLHRLEERALHLRRRAVDLVDEQKIREYGPEVRREGRLARVVDERADQVGGEQVRRALDAVEGSVECIGEGLNRERLRQARHALDEEVAAAQKAQEQALQELLLPDDDLALFGEDRVEELFVS
jgi:hypothetical protein